MQPLDAIFLTLKLGAVAVLIAFGFVYRDNVYEQGYAAAVADGEENRRYAEALARQIETKLRGELRARDADAFKKEQEYATNLEAAQRRVRAGVDGLRCPAAGPVPRADAPDDRPAAGGTAPDEPGPAIVPEVAAEILGDGAAIAGLVRRYERLEQRFDACEALTKES